MLGTRLESRSVHWREKETHTHQTLALQSRLQLLEMDTARSTLGVESP